MTPFALFPVPTVRLGTVWRQHVPTTGVDNVLDIVDPRFAAGLPSLACLKSVDPKHVLVRLRKTHSADRNRGQRKGATSKNIKNRQTVSRQMSTFFDTFAKKLAQGMNVKNSVPQKAIKNFSVNSPGQPLL